MSEISFYLFSCLTPDPRDPLFCSAPASLRPRWTSCLRSLSSGATATRRPCTLRTESTCECRPTRLCDSSPITAVTTHVTHATLCVCRACVVLGVVFILSSLCILGKAAHNLVIRMPPEVVRYTLHSHTYASLRTPPPFIAFCCCDVGLLFPAFNTLCQQTHGRAHTRANKAAVRKLLFARCVCSSSEHCYLFYKGFKPHHLSASLKEEKENFNCFFLPVLICSTWILASTWLLKVRVPLFSDHYLYFVLFLESDVVL